MSRIRPHIISIAGHDPSCGAGLAADLKTFEALKTQGLSVCSALTLQDDKQVYEVDWISEKTILKSLEILLNAFPVKWVKVGIIENRDIFHSILLFLEKNAPEVKVIWDPVFKASDGHTFHSTGAWEHWKEIIEKVYLITPNWEEMKMLFPEKDPMEAAKSTATHAHVFLKGGHNPSAPGKDHLYFDQKYFAFNPKEKVEYPKHGSGCVLASAITAYLALGFDVRRACLKGKTYTNRFLNSNRSTLGYHK